MKNCKMHLIDNPRYLKKSSKMADQGVKYAALPFIDVSGQDCFESGDDAHDSSNNITNAELQSESIDHFNVDQTKSFSVFQNKYLDATSIDFSDKIVASHKGGFESKSVYEIIGEQVAKETPQQKYSRLQHELHELAAEVENIKESNADDDSSPTKLAKEVKLLQSQLHNLHLEKVLGTEALARGGVPAGTWTRQVLSQLETLKTIESPTSGKENKDQVVYEMYYRPEHARFAQAAKLSELESKLKEVESYVGKDQQKLQSIIADPELYGSSLMDATTAIQAKLTLFDISHIEVIATRLQGLLHCINEISQKRDTIENVNNQTKITELYELITNWDVVAAVVPELIERLKALHSLNDQATSFSQSLEHLTSTQTEIRDQLRSQKDTLEKFEKSFGENVTAIQENCVSLETRISNLMKKVGA